MLSVHSSITKRDALLLLVGATTIYLWILIFPRYAQFPMDAANIEAMPAGGFTTTKTHVRTETHTRAVEHTVTATVTTTTTSTPQPTTHSIQPFQLLPHTQVLAHAPGWTLFRNLYMSNGTLIIVSNEEGRKKLPPLRMMVSTPLAMFNTPDNIAAREPTQYIMDVIDPEVAATRWSSSGDAKGPNRVWTVEGSTFLVWDPKQFLHHYYHLVAELFFGFQAFWHGAFSTPIPSSSSSPHFSVTHPSPPPIDRVIFAYSQSTDWRDDPGLNRYFLRAAFPSLTIEHEEGWMDRVLATRPNDDQTSERAFHFPLVVLADRSAATRGYLCGTTVQRTAAESWDYMRKKGKLMGIHVGGWWAPVREAIWRFAGAEEGLKALSESDPTQKHLQLRLPDDDSGLPGLDVPTPEDESEIVDVGSEHQKLLPMPEKVVISYISRQTNVRRKLIQEDHERMLKAIRELVDRKNDERRKAAEEHSPDVPPEWEFQELILEHMNKDDQFKQAARTTIMLGIHGNGLSHLVFMPPNRLSTVIEIFFPQGFAHDYYWTTRALGMTHMAVWNDTHHSYPDKPDINYLEGFQGTAIPVYGPYVAQIIEDRVAGKL